MPCTDSILTNAMNSGMKMDALESSFGGTDLANVTEKAWFHHYNIIGSYHEALSYTGRHNIKQLVQRNVLELEGTMTEDLANSIIEEANQVYGDGSELAKIEQGSTYVPLQERMILHLNTKNNCITAIVKRKNRRRSQMEEQIARIQHSWSSTINFLQTEQE